MFKKRCTTTAKRKAKQYPRAEMCKPRSGTVCRTLGSFVLVDSSQSRKTNQTLCPDHIIRIKAIAAVEWLFLWSVTGQTGLER